MKTVVVLQSSYIPWKGYFDLIHDADEFIFYDDVQFTRQDWRSRNRIKTPQGAQWLSIPVGTSQNRLICEVGIPSPDWQQAHWKTIRQNYSKCRYFTDYAPFFESVYLGRAWENLSEMNQYMIRSIATEMLGMQTRFRDSREFDVAGKKLERLLDLIKKTGGDRYISGPSAQDYIEPEAFRQAGVDLVWKDYGGYPEYEQRYPPFEHGVSILDVLFNVGPRAPEYIWGWRAGAIK